MQLSIITCTCNSAEYLQECVDSVIAQNLDHTIFEHIFVDWESADDTLSIIKKYKIEFPDWNIHVISRKKRWIYNAFNEGIKQAKGEYILFLNSDDFLNPNILNLYLQYVQKTGEMDIYFGWLQIFSQNTQKFRLPLLSRLFYPFWLNKYLLGISYYVAQPAVLEKKSVLIEYGYFNEDFSIVSDLEHYIKISWKVSSQYYPVFVSNFREHDQSTSAWLLRFTSQKEIQILFWNHYSFLYWRICLLLYSVYYSHFLWNFIRSRGRKKNDLCKDEYRNLGASQK